MKKQKNNKLAPYKNYCLAIVITLGVLLLSYLLFYFYKQYDNSKANSSYLIKEKNVKEVIDIKEAADKIASLNGNYYLYISYTGDKDIYDLEKDLKPIIKSFNLADRFYYIDVKSIKDEENAVDKINDYLQFDDYRIEKFPTIVYVNSDKKVTRDHVITRLDNNLMQAADFQQLLDVAGIMK